MPKLFRLPPPDDLVVKLLKGYGLHGLHDTNWFSKSMVSLPVIEEVLPELEPYYLPCRAKEYIHTPLTQSKAIIILRQVLASRSITLSSVEKTCGRVKGLWYQIPICSSISDTNMSFD